MPVNGTFAPVCPISRSQAPLARASVPTAIPRPIDLPSAIQAINQLITIINNPMIQNNLIGFPYIPRWSEIKRRTTTVRVYNPNDREQWVDVERITNLLFEDRSTDAQFEWQYNNPTLKPLR